MVLSKKLGIHAALCAVVRKRARIFAWMLILLCSATAGSTTAQTEGRPDVAVPEPQRKAASRTFVLSAVTYDMAVEGRDRFSNALEELVRFFTASTAVDAVLSWNVHDLNTRYAQQPLLLYMTGNEAAFTFGEYEKRNLGNYLKSGGLLYAEDVEPQRSHWAWGRPSAGMPGTPFDRQFKTLMKDALVLGKTGAYWRKIPKDHALYTSYFDFDDGPPRGAVRNSQIDYLEMLEQRGRVVVIFSELNISMHWANPKAKNRDKSLRLGANLIVFAMTQQISGGLGTGK